MQESSFLYIAQSRIIVVEDESTIGRFVQNTLEAEKALVSHVETLRLARSQCALWRPDLIVLDLGLPDGDGLDLINEIRAYSNVPIIVLSARSSENDKVKALIAGADDYLTKPFSATELLARVDASLRRSRLLTSNPNRDTSANLIQFGNCSVDLAQHIFKRNDTPEHLTLVEWRLLSVLIKHLGKVLTHQQLLTEVWGHNAMTRTHYLRIYIQRLRSKLEPNPVQPRFILTEIGIGYRLVDDKQCDFFAK